MPRGDRSSYVEKQEHWAKKAAVARKRDADHHAHH